MNQKSQIIIFTDGASRGNPGPGGWGAIIAESGDVRINADENARGLTRIVELGGREEHTTNNRMELTAAIKALEFSHTLNSGGYTLIYTEIYTDSKYLIDGITKWIFSWEKRNWVTKNKEPVLNKDLWEKLLELTKFREVEWKYVGGHSGIAGNERVDQIATEFADGKATNLFSGDISKYKIDILNLNGEEKKKSSKNRSRSKAYSYLSMVEGVVEKHKNWAECERRVKGKSGAKFKKALSAEEEKEIIKNWSL